MRKVASHEERAGLRASKHHQIRARPKSPLALTRAHQAELLRTSTTPDPFWQEETILVIEPSALLEQMLLDALRTFGYRAIGAPVEKRQPLGWLQHVSVQQPPIVLLIDMSIFPDESSEWLSKLSTLWRGQTTHDSAVVQSIE